jgi:hypothetical protein
VPICETKELREGFVRPYIELIPTLTAFGVELPQHLVGKQMHLDPDFERLTYGDQGERAKQIEQLGEGDFLAFYASLRDVHQGHLVYAIIGLMIIDEIVAGKSIQRARWNENAHTRRVPGPTDIVVRAKPKVSGRCTRAVPVGEYRFNAYRVQHDLLNDWGGLSVKDGYLQRSARLPRFSRPTQFHRWLCSNTTLMRNNN